MKNRMLLSAALVLVVVGGLVLAGVGTQATDLETPITVTETLTETVPAPVGPVSIQPEGSCEADPLAPEGLQTACCIDQCRRDKDCRTVCGFEFGGQCVQVNSCCRECFCFGFAPGVPS